MLRGAAAPVVAAHEQLEVVAQRALLVGRRRPQPHGRHPPLADGARARRHLQRDEQHARQLLAHVARLPRLAGDGDRIDLADRRRFAAAPAPASTGTVFSSMPSAAKSGPRAPPTATPSSCSITCPDHPLVRTRPTGTGSPSASASSPSSTPTSARACASSASRSDRRLDSAPRLTLIQFRGNVRPAMDEARIQEIVDRVIARIGELPETPMEAVSNPPPGYVAPPPRRAPRRRRGGARSTSRAGAGACSPTSTRP